MSAPASPGSFFIGWDVGGWNCDHNPNSRDALVILDSALSIVGQPWRGSLRAWINASATPRAFIDTLFALCSAAFPGSEASSVTLAIDAPLGFPSEFVSLVTELRYAEPLEASEKNPYLYRQAEFFLFEHGLKPLSPIKDMIGSQATKGRHVLAKFAPHIVRCGVWSGGGLLTAIEAYPSACKKSRIIQQLRQHVLNPPAGPGDQADALTCALVAFLFSQHPDALEPPGDQVPASEGWIWAPKDIFERKG